MRIKLSTGSLLEKGADGLYWAEVLRCGRWDYPGMDGGGFDVTDPILHEFKQNFDAGEKGPEVLLNVGHDDDQEAGWVKKLDVRGSGDDPTSGAKLFAGFSIDNPPIKEKVDLGLLKFTSSELDFEYVNPEACRTSGDCAPRRVFEGLALTNRPFIKGMQPITLCEPYTKNSPDHRGCKCGERRDPKNKEGHMPKTAEELQQELDATQAQLAEHNSIKAQLDEEKRRNAATERRLRDLEVGTRLDQVKTKLKELVGGRRPKITPHVAARVLRLCEGLVKGGAATVQLSEKVKVSKIKLAEGDKDESEDIDKLDVVSEVLDMLQELPDALASKDDSEADLEEDDSDKDDDDDQDKPVSKAKASERKALERKAIATAKAKCAENPSLDYLSVYAAEAKKLGIHKGGR